ncbi:hypothetical protein POTOM_005669 [Populus tomentosa]|uniref:Uncharacterized protein n=1 Tax=Populus tomentosa TaxID=118781 RepID=A0A8X8DE34_POPTO|nr:hypothetical protein POTOM_005669 [Populus tomentosa]
MCFYSAPTSPTKGTSIATYDLESMPATQKTYEDANSNLDDFEFETSRRFNIGDIDSGGSMRYEDAMEEQQKHQHKESLPAMASADELFCDGKVIPLKPPPCHNHSSTLTSPESQMAKIKISFPRRNVWNDDFDPFMVALKTVKGERKEKWQKINHTRARSMSPIRARSDLMDCMHKQCKQLDPIRPHLNNQQELNGLPTRIWIPNITNASPKRLAESKGAGENAKETGEPSERKSKRQSMKNFLYRSLSTRRNDEHRKQTEQTIEVSKSKTKRKLSFKSMGLVVRNGERGGSQITKVTQTCYKPKLSLCMGNGAKYVE